MTKPMKCVNISQSKAIGDLTKEGIDERDKPAYNLFAPTMTTHSGQIFKSRLF